MFAGSTLIFGAISAHAVGVAGVALAGALLASGLGVDTVYSTGDLDNVAWIDEHDPSTLPLPVTVNVEMVWNFSPNWEEGVLEKLTWATDILQSETLVEQRRALRQAPRREFEAAFILDSGNARALDIALFAHGAGKWIVPIWPEVQTLQNNLPNDSTTLPADTANSSRRSSTTLGPSTSAARVLDCIRSRRCAATTTRRRCPCLTRTAVCSALMRTKTPR